MKPYEKAGRIFRLFGWLQAIGFLGMLIGIIVPFLAGNKTIVDTMPLLPMFALIIMPIFFFKLGTAVKEHKDWGRFAGIIISIIFLFGFPIGTIIGGYTLWCLTKGWE